MECNNIYYAVDIDGEVFVKSDSEVSEIGHGCKIIGVRWSVIHRVWLTVPARVLLFA